MSFQPHLVLPALVRAAFKTAKNFPGPQISAWLNAVFSNMLHLYAPLVAPLKHIPGRGDQVCEVSCRAEACVILCVSGHFGSVQLNSRMPEHSVPVSGPSYLRVMYL
jgi:hypothetical protein